LEDVMHSSMVKACIEGFWIGAIFASAFIAFQYVVEPFIR